MALSGPRRGTARIAILTITDEEFAAARTVFQTNVHLVGSPYFVSAVSPQGSYDVVVRRIADQTNLPSRDAVSLLVEDFRPEMFLLIGTAGGVYGRDNVLLGDVVVANYVEYCEYWKLLPKRHAPRRLIYDQPSVFLREHYAEGIRHTGTWIPAISADRPPQAMAELLRDSPITRAWSRLSSPFVSKRVLTSDKAPKTRIGNIVSGEKIWGDPTSEEQRRIFRYYDKALAVEMEAAGVARGVMGARSGVAYNPQYLVIRGISDLVNCQGNDETRHKWTEYAAATAAAFAWRVAADYLNVPQVI